MLAVKNIKSNLKIFYTADWTPNTHFAIFFFIADRQPKRKNVKLASADERRHSAEVRLLIAKSCVVGKNQEEKYEVKANN